MDTYFENCTDLLAHDGALHPNHISASEPYSVQQTQSSLKFAPPEPAVFQWLGKASYQSGTYYGVVKFSTAARSSGSSMVTDIAMVSPAVLLTS